MSDIDWSKAPEGATHYCPETEDLMAAWFKPSGSEWLFALDQSPMRDWRPYLEDFPRDMPVVERPTAWTGEGLPPVGIECEAHWESTPKDVWLPVKVLAHDEGMVVFRWKGGERKGEYSSYSQRYNFRPIRTPEQIAADVRESHINGMLSHDALGGTRRGLAEALYDAGYRKATA